MRRRCTCETLDRGQHSGSEIACLLVSIVAQEREIPHPVVDMLRHVLPVSVGDMLLCRSRIDEEICERDQLLMRDIQ
jgi:hypothetical protein